MSEEERNRAAIFGQSELSGGVDGRRLAEEIALDDEEIEWRKNFVGFDETDVENLDGLSDPFAARADELGEKFYDHLERFEQTREIIESSSRNIDQLERTQREYFRSLARGEYNRQYFTNRARIGKVHDLLDMPLKHYIGQYAVYYDFLLDVTADRIRDRVTDTVEETLERADVTDVEELESTLLGRLNADVADGLDELGSVLKLLNLDMQVAADTYLRAQVDEVEHERDRFAALFENIPTPVVVVQVAERNLRVKRVNDAFEQLFGYSAADLAHYDFERFLAPPGEEPKPVENRSIVENIRTSSESELSEAEVVLETQFGRREFIRVAAPIEQSETDNIEYAFYIDITDQKQRQERLKVLSRILRHDFRNKINIVKGSASTLMDQREGKPIEEAANRIEQTSDELLSKSEKIRQIEQFVDSEPKREPINVPELVERAIENVTERYPNCEFSSSVPEGIRVHGSWKLELAVEEIVENAAEHNDAAEPRVTVTVTTGENSQYVEICVADNGAGIPPVEYEILTGERERSQIDHSSGLGLWVVNWIVTRLGGSLDFSPNSPSGSVVTIRLPRMPSPESSEESVSKPE